MGEMSKTPEEIKKGLECCMNDSFLCKEECPYFNSLSNGVDCAVKKNADALAYIRRLEANDSQVRKALHDNGFGSLEELLQAFSQVKRERDAAVMDIHKGCSTCKHYYYNRQDDGTKDCLWFDDCKIEDHWEWCGVQEKEE